jgi:hypothetical protein
VFVPRVELFTSSFDCLRNLAFYEGLNMRTVKNTVLILLPPDQLLDLALTTVKSMNLKARVATHYLDLLSVQFCFAIVDPTLLSRQEWKSLREFYIKAKDYDRKVLLTQAPPEDCELPELNYVETPSLIDGTFLRGLLSICAPPAGKG